jgi:hypothetical protein
MVYVILTTSINPITCRHSIQCDLCEVVIDLGISATGSTIHKHRDHDPCRNALYHLISEHSSNGIIPEIPGELLVNMFIHKVEEKDLGIDQKVQKG